MTSSSCKFYNLDIWLTQQLFLHPVCLLWSSGAKGWKKVTPINTHPECLPCTHCSDTLSQARLAQSWRLQVLWGVYKVLQHTQCKGPSLCTLIYPAVKSCSLTLSPSQTRNISRLLSLWFASRYSINLRLLMLYWQRLTITSSLWVVLMKASLPLTEVNGMNDTLSRLNDWNSVYLITQRCCNYCS